MKNKYKLILASASASRAELLSFLGIPFTKQSANIDELVVKEKYTDPVKIVEELASGKALAVAEKASDLEHSIVIGFDTVVVRNKELLGKPKDEEDAKRMLKLLIQYKDNAYTGICIMDPEEKEPIVKSERVVMQFPGITEADIDVYLKSGEPLRFGGAMNPMSRFAMTFGDSDVGYVQAFYSFPMKTLHPILRKYDLFPDFSKLPDSK